MRFDTKYRPWLVVSLDRPRLFHVKLDVARSRLFATNGHALAAIPCSIEDGDTDGLISAYALRMAARAARRRGDARARIDCSSPDVVKAYGMSFERPRPDLEGEFPAVASALPPPGDRIRINVDARLLLRAARALGAGRSGRPAHLEITVGGSDQKDAMVIKAHDRGGDVSYGLVMPLLPPAIPLLYVARGIGEWAAKEDAAAESCAEQAVAQEPTRETR